MKECAQCNSCFSHKPFCDDKKSMNGEIYRIDYFCSAKCWDLYCIANYR